MDNDANGYFIHHRKQGKLITYDFVGQCYEEAAEAYEAYWSQLHFPP